MPLKIRGKDTLRLQKVDWVASLLMAALMVIGLLVFILFLYWLTQTLSWKSSGSIAIAEERIAGRGDHAAGFARDMEPPGAEEAVELAAPSLENSLQAVTDIATSVAGSFESVSSEALTTVVGAGQGDSRPPGPLGEGDDIVPRHQRWELKFQAKGLNDYAQQLDFYGIELATIGGGVNTVDYASNVSTNPTKRSGSSDEENKRKRLYFMWRSENPLKIYDEQLLSQAGVATQGRQLLKFIPKQLEDRLAQIELEFAKRRGYKSVIQIAKTLFESRQRNDGFDFEVVEQYYRSAQK